MTAPLRKDVTAAEEPYLTLDAVQILAIGDELRAQGKTNAQAVAVEGWLLRKAAGMPDLTSHNTRARYRRWLAELAEAPRPGRGQRGLADVVALAGAVAVLAVAMVARTSPDAGAQLLLAWSTCHNEDGRESDLVDAADAQVVELDTHRPRTLEAGGVSAVHTLAA